ncbi:rho GTPase-activating protein 20-like [Aplochiton taeniatus]
MDSMSPQQQNEGLSRRRTSLAGETKISGQYEGKRRMKSLSHRRQSAPSQVISKALTRSKTLSRENLQEPVCPETCPLVYSFLTSPDRSFILHGHAQLKTGLQTQDRHLFLFTDLLIIAKAKSVGHFKLKTQACVCDMWTAGCMEEVCEGSTSPEMSFVLGWPTCNCVVTFSRIKEEKEKDDPKTIPLKVYGKDINTFAVTKTLAVSNCDSTNEVIRLALQQFAIAGSVKDYQLWVSSKRENAPYPLIGHEFPFSIQMSHVRDPPCHGSAGGRDAAPPDRQRATTADQLQVDKLCQFILRPRRIASTQHPVIAADPAKKPFKRRRSLISWAFWRGSNPQLNDLSISLSSPASGCLFGQSLSSVCHDDTLPKPIMDMLVFLYHEGPFTRGIFRRSAGARACRELRDSLDSGASELPLTREHVFIIAGVFKDFLRNIPASLLASELYEEWMDLMEEEEEEEEQIWAVQRLIGQLPKENALLLRHVVAVLHAIQGNAHDNQMNSFNLSVCIAPSMLWAPGPSSPEVEGKGAKKVCLLVRFIIDHCHEILGEDLTALFGGPPQRRSSAEFDPDAWSYPLTDSSYDSLENELDADSVESPSLRARRGRHQGQAPPLRGSLDSILTLSDCDLDPPEVDTDPDVAERALGRPGDARNLQLPPSGRPRARTLAPATGPSCPSSGARRAAASASPEPFSPAGPRRRRRSSEPALSFPSGFVVRMGSVDGLTDGGDEDEEGYEEEEGFPETEGHPRRGVAGPGGACEGSRSVVLGASCSSLSSTPTSPTPTRSSGDSLDSLLARSGQRAPTWRARARARAGAAKNPLTSISAAFRTSSSVQPVPAPIIISAPIPTPMPAPAPAPAPEKAPCPRSSPPKDSLSWGVLKSSRGLHPNTWLKKGRRPSMQQQDNVDEMGEDEKTEEGPGDKSSRKPVQEKCETGSWSELLRQKQTKGGRQERGRAVAHDPAARPPKPGSASPPPHHHSLGSLQFQRPADKPLSVRQLTDIYSQACRLNRATGCDAPDPGKAAVREPREVRSPPQGVFFGQSGPSLSLYRNKSNSLTPEENPPAPWLSARRASEPGLRQLGNALALDRASALHLERLHREALGGERLLSDPGVRVSQADCPGVPNEEPQYCLSPSATKTVRDYFSSHRRSNPQSGQQVALALVQGRREWLRRCSDPMAEPDLDQLLFAEESYV